MVQKRLARIFALSLSVPLLLGTLAACGAGTSSGSTSNNDVVTIKVATELPVSGKDTSSGKPTENGAHVAVDELQNSIPGYKIVFEAKDDVGSAGTNDPTVGAQNIKSLITDTQVAGVVGPFNSGVAKAEMPDANNAPLALISPSNTNQCLTQENPDIGCKGSNDLVPTLRPTGKVTYFRIATTDDHQGPANADYLYKEANLNLKKAYVIDDTTVYGVGIATTFSNEWTKLGGTVLGRSSEPSTTTSYVSLLTDIASKQPDVIYFGGTDANGGLSVRQQMQQVPALKNTVYAGGDGLVTDTFATTIGTTGGPVFGTVASSDSSKNPNYQKFLDSYKKYGDIGSYSAAGYDCMKILINAIHKAIDAGAKPAASGDTEAAKKFRQAVIDQIQKTSYDGLTGHHSFDVNGDTTNKVITIQQIETVDGKAAWKILKSVTVA
ncbi:branched-chain amino acid ABC transporter substrate-binding protein [Tengunoibacter tsumagoiensis]|uniref:Branched chain amino acid ABC transporter substrate-binding protein n=1 Tax=Tengunoibacter tsumagoiensis TaxID=2014871 RepID=A0A402A121_9CHLR|nr:branched-chain amino acid ABC transporter substrate-binding protein [Tengunoibacter tsumagoiensis]GCE12752.1 branched chain amino acid ABC transporter substrate-binding protein [Tengunoibacter tsumagoiensis]